MKIGFPAVTGRTKLKGGQIKRAAPTLRSGTAVHAFAHAVLTRALSAIDPRHPTRFDLKPGHASSTLFLAARGTPSSRLLPKDRGERSADRRWHGTPCPWPVSRSGRSLLALERSSGEWLASPARLSALHVRLLVNPGPRFSSRLFGPRPSASSWQPARSGRRAEPRAARVLGCEPSPQGPRLAPPARRLRKAPLKERGGAHLVAHYGRIMIRS